MGWHVKRIQKKRKGLSALVLIEFKIKEKAQSAVHQYKELR
uniref:Uncharacterized protein n=1 Tax=Arundo donax TaxID=35708 RepID=A0A0A9CLZ0_ARUDO